MSEPTTPTGKRQHDLAWSQVGLPVLGDHSNDPDDCSACRFIKRIEQEAAAPARADADRLAEALRDAIDVAHETDSLRSHSDDERKNGWFRAPLYRCPDAICEAANAAIAAHDAAQVPVHEVGPDDREDAPNVPVAHVPPFDGVEKGERP